MVRTKTEIRKFWMLLTMLDKKPRTQNEFINELMYIGHFIDLTMGKSESLIKYDSFMNGNKDLDLYQQEREQKNISALKKAVSEILKEFENNKIVKKNIREAANKTGRNPSVYELIRNKEALLNTLDGIYDHEHRVLNPEIRNHTMMTPYIIEMVNMELVKKLEKISKFDFTNEEREIILNILKNSGSALLFALKDTPILGHTMTKYEEDYSNEYSEIKNEYQNDFIFNLQLKLGEDMAHSEGFVKASVPFIYETSIEFFPEYDPYEKEIAVLRNRVMEYSGQEKELGMIRNSYIATKNKLITGTRIQPGNFKFFDKYDKNGSSIKNLFDIQFDVTGNIGLLMLLSPFK